MGILQTAFAGSQVLGLPAGLFLTNHWGWHMPFIMIVVVSSIVGLVIFMKLEPLKSHLTLQSDRKAYQHLLHTVKIPTYLLAFGTTGLISLGGFMIMPFASAFTVNNMKIPPDQLPLIYLVTGICSIFIGPLVGRLSDMYGKYKVFIFGSVVTIIMILIYTQREVTPLYFVMLINALLFTGIFSRMIPSQALMSAIPSPADRGAFMSVSSSLQQLAGGIGSLVAGSIVVQQNGGRIEHFEILGYIMTGIVILCVVLMFFVNKHVNQLTAKSV